MADDVVPGVDPAEVAALERAAESSVHLRPNEGAGLQGADGGMRSGTAPGSRPAAQEEATVRPASPLKGALETLGEQAVAKEFSGLRQDLADLKRWGRHTMHLVMVLAHVLRVAPEEVDEAKRKVDAADAAMRKES